MTEEEKAAAAEAARVAAEAQAAEDAKTAEKQAQADADAAAAAKAKADDKTGAAEDAVVARAEAAAAKAAAKAAKDEAEALKKAFEGIDPAQARAAMAAARAAETKALEEKGDFERVRAMIVEEHEKTVASLNETIAKLQGDLTGKDTTIAEMTVGQHFNTSKFIGEKLVVTPTKARRLYGDYFDTEDGTVVPYDKPKGEAGRAKLLDTRGLPLSFEAAIEKIVSLDPEHEHMLRATVKPGANSKTDDKSVPENTTVSRLDKIAQGVAKLVGG